MVIDHIGKLLRNSPDLPGKGFIARKIFSPFIRGRGYSSIVDMKNPGGGKIICNLDEPLPWNLFVYGNYRFEKGCESFMLEKVKTCDVVFDIGANIGYYSIQYARLTNGKIYSFEPMAHQHETLVKNLQLNNLSNVVAVKYAVSNSNEIKRIYLSEDENTGTSSIEVPTSHYEDVETITIDSYCEKMGINQIDLMKIDIEGHEYKALQGMKKMLSKGNIKGIFMEIHTESLQFAGTSPQEVCTYLGSFGYYPHSIMTGAISEYKIGNDESLVYFCQNSELE